MSNLGLGIGRRDSFLSHWDLWQDFSLKSKLINGGALTPKLYSWRSSLGGHTSSIFLNSCSLHRYAIFWVKILDFFYILKFMKNPLSTAFNEIKINLSTNPDVKIVFEYHSPLQMPPSPTPLSVLYETTIIGWTLVSGVHI